MQTLCVCSRKVSLVSFAFILLTVHIRELEALAYHCLNACATWGLLTIIMYKKLPESGFGGRQTMERKHLHVISRQHQNCSEQLQAAGMELHWQLQVKALLPLA